MASNDLNSALLPRELQRQSEQVVGTQQIAASGTLLPKSDVDAFGRHHRMDGSSCPSDLVPKTLDCPEHHESPSQILRIACKLVNNSASQPILCA